MQLDLFDWRQQNAEIIAFPADRRIGRIASIARQIIHAESEAIAERRWQAAINRLRAELTTNGFSHSVHVEQIQLMAHAVRQRIQHLSQKGEIAPSTKQYFADDKFKYSPTWSKEAN
ncbi:MAG: hypothetical protein JJ979_07335 [Roseibium sp.]|nr:hypothetical protein [Roseibium sp.]